jgi:poly(3-hydroxybutyrate) depolymerase
MMYRLYQTQLDLMSPVRNAAVAANAFFGLPWHGFSHGLIGESVLLRAATAAGEIIANSATTHRRPPFHIAPVLVGNRHVEIVEEIVVDRPFGALLHFRKAEPLRQPKMLLVAPMSGHFATLLRGTVQTLLADHDVYITDWHNARDVALMDGDFAFDDFVGHVIEFLEILGRGSHVMAVCQPAVAVLAAVSLMAEDENPATPRTMTLMAGPIDTRMRPTKVNQLAKTHSIGWFRRNLISRVPLRFNGRMRAVYPGFMQLTAFMSMNIERHTRAHFKQFRNLLNGDPAANVHRDFYNEYLAVMDLPAEFYLQTIQRVFQDHDLPRGALTYKGRTVNPAAIRRTALLTVEGELDDICSIGQTQAALDLCPNIPTMMKRHHLQTNAGHYGVFNGKRWQHGIYPIVRETVQSYMGI